MNEVETDNKKTGRETQLPDPLKSNFINLFKYFTLYSAYINKE